MTNAFTYSYPLADGTTLTVTGTIAAPTPTPTPTPVPTPTPTPVTNPNLITIGAATWPLAGTNVVRVAETIVRYMAPVTVTPTNQWGVEVTVNPAGIVTAINDRQLSQVTSGTLVPATGYVLSGHDTGRTWLLTYAKVGTSVTLSTTTTTTPTPTPTPTPKPIPTPTPTPVPSGSAQTLAIYQMMWQGDGSVTAIPAQCNEIRLAFAQGSPPSLVGWANDGQSAFVSAVTAFHVAGKRIILSIGGAGGSVDISDHAAFLSGVASIRSQLGGILDGIDWDLEAVAMTNDAVTISSALKSTYGSGFRISFAPNGSNVEEYLAAAVACQNAGCLDSYGQQFYDAPVSENAALGRINEAISAGIPANKITVGMMIANDSSHWTNQQCVDNYTQLKAAVPGLNGAYLWENSRAGTAQWAQQVGALVFA